jgi:hypothetical protein
MVIIPPGIEASLSKEHITAADVADAVGHCEETNAKVLDEESGEYTGYRESGHITLWVRYRTVGADAELLDCYFNRTKITGVSHPVADPGMRLGPMLEPIRNKRLLCCKCDIPLEIRKVLFKYTEQKYYAMNFACPACGQIYENKEIIRYQAEKVEVLLEGK